MSRAPNISHYLHADGTYFVVMGQNGQEVIKVQRVKEGLNICGFHDNQTPFCGCCEVKTNGI